MEQNQNTSATQNQGQPRYNTPAVTIGNLVKDGSEFILIERSRQGQGFTIHSSGDRDVTKQLFKQAWSQVDDLQTA